AGLIAEAGEHSYAPAKPETQTLQPAKRHITHTDMATAVLGDPAMAALLQETQRLLGKQLSVSESRLLFELASEHDMPAAVLLLLVSYWSGTAPQKKVLTETARTAKEWAELDIRSVETAEQQLLLMETRRSRQSSVAKLLGREDDLTRSERKRIDEWFEQFGYDEAFVSEVLLRKADAGIPYIHSVLKDWHKKGYRSISDTRVAPINIQPEAAMPQSGETGSLLQRAAARNKRKENG
ncbi:MAG: DnaD domain protein, partial [Oscillospiraceae bacterium]|nr:DnaD domain protein [Oscillospiraceae bacterium]